MRTKTKISFIWMSRIWYFILALYLFNYVYFAYKASLFPLESKWGWLCAFSFSILSIMSISLYSKYGQSKKSEDRSESD